MTSRRRLATAALCLGGALARCGGEITTPDPGADDAATDASVGDVASDASPAAARDCSPTVDASCGPCAPCIANGTEACVSGSCVITCDPGFGILNGECHPAR